ncbi:hypothetical protein DKG34_38700 [Streptomyces sp. NWU49]|uniref:hypothetical protein n=1 Tax=Streptomyces sp. NWU49 TaxID=2201153 RepID=UPI000D677002|nr:hypothetical protein [Streptomyces sp. NWU49]PWJ02409.1 hypothetical protein DKG34_38700 [Streptomyces sp. NWU49]
MTTRDPLYGAAADAVRDQLHDSYHPLRDPDDTQVCPGSVAGELGVALALLTEVAAANIHDHNAMVRAAVGLEHRLRSLVAAIETERGEHR